MKDIYVETVVENVMQEVKVTYSTLQCRGCRAKERFKGTVEMNRLYDGWAALDINMNTNGAVYGWLLCPKCVAKVKESAGLAR